MLWSLDLHLFQITFSCSNFTSLTLQRVKAPALVPEDADPIWSVGARSILSKGTGMKQRVGRIVKGIHSRLGDPRTGPVLLLGALMSFGNIWLRRSQSTPPSQSNEEALPSGTVSMMCSTFFISGIQLFLLILSFTQIKEPKEL